MADPTTKIFIDRKVANELMMMKKAKTPTSAAVKSSSPSSRRSQPAATSLYNNLYPYTNKKKTNLTTAAVNPKRHHHQFGGHHHPVKNVTSTTTAVAANTYLQRQKKNLYDDQQNQIINDDSAIGMSEKHPLIRNEIGGGNVSNYSDSDFDSNGGYHHHHRYSGVAAAGSSDGGSSGLSDDFDSDRNGDDRRSLSTYNSDDHRRKKKPKMLPDPESLTTNLQTLMHIIKANIGTGILAMPDAFKNAGLFVGLGILPILCMLCTHCMHILVRANNIVSKRLSTGRLEYQELAAHAVSLGPRPLRRYTRLTTRLVNGALLITQLGFCCVYSLFVAENVRKFTMLLSKNQIEWDKRIFLLAMLPLFILLSFVKSLRHLSLASSMANLLQTVGLMIVMLKLVQDLPPTDSVPAYGELSKFPLFLGTAIYAFEGISLVLPLQKEMREPEALGGYVGVLNAAMSIVACLNIAIGFFGYLKFGDQVKGSITLNMPDDPLYLACQMMFAVAIFLSYAIQYYVPLNIMWPWFRTKLHLKEGTKKADTGEYIFRALLVAFTVALAAAIPKLELFISLVGSVSSSGLALIFPPIIDICVLWDEERGTGKWTWIFVKNFLIFMLGIAGFTTGTYASVENIITHINDNETAA